MLFAPDDWTQMLQGLLAKTQEGKVSWERTQYPAGAGLSGLSLFRYLNRVPDFRSVVGANTFSMGSTDGDGQPPFFITVTHEDEADDVTDTLVTERTGLDPRYRPAVEHLEALYLLVNGLSREKARAARSIIADIDKL